jgi:hypothetical protein
MAERKSKSTPNRALHNSLANVGAKWQIPPLNFQIAIIVTNFSPLRSRTMAAVYKQLTKKTSKAKDGEGSAPQQNKQRVLILSTRGITYRYPKPQLCSLTLRQATAFNERLGSTHAPCKKRRKARHQIEIIPPQRIGRPLQL